MRSNKQLLQLTKTELLAEYRKLEESMNNKEESSNLSLEEALEVVKSNGYVVKPRTSYDF